MFTCLYRIFAFITSSRNNNIFLFFILRLKTAIENCFIWYDLITFSNQKRFFLLWNIFCQKCVDCFKYCLVFSAFKNSHIRVKQQHTKPIKKKCISARIFMNIPKFHDYIIW